MRLSAQIKAFCVSKLNIPSDRLRVETGKSKHPFISVRILAENRDTAKGSEPYKYEHEFPLELRQKALRLIYGENCTFADAGSAGNIRAHDIAMHAPQWEALLAFFANHTEIK